VAEAGVDSEEAEADLEIETLVDSEKEEDLKCMMLFVINARKNARFRSNLREINQFYAVTVSDKMEERALVK
jgi:hypothetical protein